MPKKFTPAEQYAGRPPGVVQVNMTLDREAVDILRRLAPSYHARGMFLSRLLHEHLARQEERQRFLASLKPEPEAMDSVSVGADGEE